MIETYFLHNNTVKLEIDHSKTRHRYLRSLKLPTGKWTKPEIIEGVTHYLETIPKYLGPWYAKEASDYWLSTVNAADDLGILKLMSRDTYNAAKGAADNKGKVGRNKGTDMHNALECYFKQQPIPVMSELVQILYDRVVYWWEHSGWTFVSSEAPVYSKLMGYGGKKDLDAITDTGKYVICDFKSTKLSRQAPHGVYLEMFIQGGGYAEPTMEEGRTVDDIVILNPNNVDRDGHMVPIFASGIGMAVEDAIHAFSAAKALTDILAYWNPKVMQRVINDREGTA